MANTTKVKKTPNDKQAPKKGSGAASGSAVAEGVTVRMFCHGLGDCFLLAIPQGNKTARPYHILIDCGIAMGTEGETGLMQEVVREIAELTRPKPKGKGKPAAANEKGVIDLLVVTHEHRDHVSGFIQAQEQFAELDILNAWFAWTEDRTDDLANQLRTKHAKEKATLARAFATAKSLAAATPASNRLLRALDGVLAFHAPIEAPAPAAAAKAGAKGGVRVDVSDAMEIAGKLAKTGKPETLHPGKVLPLPGAEASGTAHGVRAFVLGPPHDGPTLRRINPRKKDSETYEKAPKDEGAGKNAAASLAGLGMNWTWAAGLAGHAAAQSPEMDAIDAATQSERAMPFDSKWRRPLNELKDKKEGFFATHYFDAHDVRRIDADWLFSGAQQLALYMESYTNNTSLALAFQLPNSGKVLLFAADAQVGSWLSWHGYDFKPESGDSLKCSDLLARTVLYKVGHHGSHNATLREKGLEMMIHPELVAMLPVEKVAVDRLGYGEMPLISLLTELKKRTHGRVLHLDQEWDGDKAPGEWGANMQAASRSAKTFQSGANGRRLFMEYTVVDR